MVSLGTATKRNDVENPLPWKQLNILLVLHLAEPVSATIIYPFIAQLIQELGLGGEDRSDVGYYVGLIESIFFITEATLILQWGRLSDRIGRKPVLMMGLLGVALSMTSFGLSHSLITVIVSRALSGALNGNTGVLKSAVGEISDETNMARAFSFIPLVWFVGSTIAPLMGGYLSHPAERFPQWFSGSFWINNPYFLPCGMAAAFAFCSSIMTGVFLKETHPLLRKSRRKRYTRSIGSESTLYSLEEQTFLLPSSPIQEKKADVDELNVPLRNLLTTKVILAVINYGLLAFLEISFQALLPTFLATALHFPPSTIGLILGAMGLVNGVVQIALFVPLHRRVGTGNLFTIGVCAFGIIYATFPFIKKDWDANGGVLGWKGFLLLGVQIALCPIENMSFNVIFLYIRAASPSQATLGATNGIAQTVASIARALGPASATSLFALSMQRPDILDGCLVYYILGIITVLCVAVSRMLPAEPCTDSQGKVIDDCDSSTEDDMEDM